MYIHIHMYICIYGPTKNTAVASQRPKTSRGRTTTNSQQGQINHQQPAGANQQPKTSKGKSATKHPAGALGPPWAFKVSNLWAHLGLGGPMDPTSIYIYIYICMCLYVYICMYVNLSLSLYIYMYVHTYIYT